MKSDWQRSKKNNALTIGYALFFCLLSITIMVIDHKQPQRLVFFKNALQTVSYPLQLLASSPNSIMHWSQKILTSRDDLTLENESLKQKQLLIETQLQRMISLDAENKRLRMLLKSSSEVNQPTLIAELVAIDFNPYRHLILLNRGSNDSVNVGQPVINQQGVIGQIIEITPYSSHALLVTDPNHLLPIEVNRNGLRGLAAGTGNKNQLEILNIQNGEDINVGDLLLTSGLDGRFPAGYAVARVESVTFSPNTPFAKIIAKTTANMDKLHEVLIITPEHNLNIHSPSLQEQ